MSCMMPTLIASAVPMEGAANGAASPPITTVEVQVHFCESMEELPNGRHDSRTAGGEKHSYHTEACVLVRSM